MSNIISPFAMRLNRSSDWFFRGFLCFETNLSSFEQFYIYSIFYNFFYHMFMLRTKMHFIFVSFNVIYFQNLFFFCIVFRNHFFHKLFWNLFSFCSFLKNSHFFFSNRKFLNHFLKKWKKKYFFFHFLCKIFCKKKQWNSNRFFLQKNICFLKISLFNLNNYKLFYLFQKKNYFRQKLKFVFFFLQFFRKIYKKVSVSKKKHWKSLKLFFFFLRKTYYFKNFFKTKICRNINSFFFNLYFFSFYSNLQNFLCSSDFSPVIKHKIFSKTSIFFVSFFSNFLYSFFFFFLKKKIKNYFQNKYIKIFFKKNFYKSTDFVIISRFFNKNLFSKLNLKILIFYSFLFRIICKIFVYLNKYLQKKKKIFKTFFFKKKVRQKFVIFFPFSEKFSHIFFLKKFQFFNFFSIISFVYYYNFFFYNSFFFSFFSCSFIRYQFFLYYYYFYYYCCYFLFTFSWNSLKNHLFFFLSRYYLWYFYFFNFSSLISFYIVRFYIRFFWYILLKKLFFFTFFVFPFSYKLVLIHSTNNSLESFNVLVYIRRFISKNLDLRTILKASFPVFKVFKGVCGFSFQAYGRFARRGRAFFFKHSFGLDKSRVYDTPGDYSCYVTPLLFGVGCLRLMFFRREGFLFRYFPKCNVSGEFF